MDQISPSTSALLTIPPDTTGANSVLKKLPTTCYEISRFVESKRSFDRNGEAVACTVFTYTYSKGERLARLVIFCLGSLLLFPLLSAEFRQLCAASREFVILPPAVHSEEGLPGLASAANLAHAEETIF